MGEERRSGVVQLSEEANPATGRSDRNSTKPYHIAKRAVWDAYQQVKANRGAAGIDDETIAMFEQNLAKNQYKLWNRMSSGSYFPPPVKQVEIPKAKGGTRQLGIPTVADRIAQTVVKQIIEPMLEPVFHPDSLFETLWKANEPEQEEAEQEEAESSSEPEQQPEKAQDKKRTGRQPLARSVVRERVIHDLAESEKHCPCCGKDLHLAGEETSERYEFIPAVVKLVEDVRLKYACDCKITRADKPAQPIEKSTAGASVLAQVIVSKFADHLPLHRQERMFERHGVEISRKTMGGWMAQSAGRLEWLYAAAKKVLFQSKVIGTDDTGVKVLDPSLNFARTGRIWPYVGDLHHPVVVYDYTATRGRDGPAKFLEGYSGYLQADAYPVYDAFFKPARGLIEVGCMRPTRAGTSLTGC